jgi:hypothetical protein
MKRQGVTQIRFYQLLRGLASRPGGLRVLVHFYSGKFETEDVGVGETVSIPDDRLGEVRMLPEMNSWRLSSTLADKPLLPTSDSAPRNGF